MTEKVKVTVWTTQDNFIARQAMSYMKFINETRPGKVQIEIEEKTMGRRANTLAEFQAEFPGVTTVPRFIVNDTKMTDKELYAFIKSL